jgi:hypothetical protein
MSNLFIDTPHLVFVPHETQIDTPLDISKDERNILKELGKRYSDIASLPIQDKRKKIWESLNDLKKVKPLIWMNEVCWNEMDINGELRLMTDSIFCQRIELEIRRTLYQWKYMQGDMIVESTLYSPYIIENSGFGIEIVADISETEKDREIASRHFHNQLETEEDIEKIKVPKIRHKEERTEEFYEAYKDIFDGIIDVKKRACPGFWFAPWDDIVFWMGADKVLLNLATRPEFMHKIIDRLLNVYLEALDIFEEENLLARNDTNLRIGSGAYGYTDELPTSGYNKDRVKPIDIWGAATPQIFGSVSPEMHKEFGIDYEIKWLKRFGLTYYGCCEPLHNRIHILRDIPNLRKISISPWADIKTAVRNIGRDYVISLKPNPSVLAMDNWKPDLVRQELKRKLDIAKDCNVEIIIKDISTVRYEPHRLWEWTKIATEVTREYE